MARRSTRRWQRQHTAMEKVVRYDDKANTLTFLGQYAAKRKGARWFVRLKKPSIDNEHTTP